MVEKLLKLYVLNRPWLSIVHHLISIEKDEQVLDSLSNRYNITAIAGNSTSMQVLEEIIINRVDLLLLYRMKIK